MSKDSYCISITGLKLMMRCERVVCGSVPEKGRKSMNEGGDSTTGSEELI